MGVFSGSLTYTRFTVVQDEKSKVQFTKAINTRAFVPLTPSSEAEESAGWVPIERPMEDEVNFAGGDYMFGENVALSYRQDKWAISRGRLRSETRKRIEKICEEEKKPIEEIGKAYIKSVEKATLAKLKARSQPRTKVIEVIWNPRTSVLRVYGQGTVVNERVAGLFERTFGVRLEQDTWGQRSVDFANAHGARATTRLVNLNPTPIFLGAS